MRRLGLALFLLFVLAGAVALWRSLDPPPEVRVEKPRRGDLEVRFVAGGRVEAASIPLVTKWGGHVRTVLVEENQEVRKGQLVATLDEGDLRSRLDSLQASLDIALQRRAEALSRLARVEADTEAAIDVARAEYDKTRWDSEGAVAAPDPERLRKAEGAVEEAEARLADASANAARVEKLFAEDIVAREELERARTEETVARLRRDNARSDLKLLRQGPTRETRGSARASEEAAAARVRRAERGRMELDLYQHEVEIQTAEARRLRAEIDGVRQQMRNYVIEAPADGVISRVTVRPGDGIPGFQPLMTLVVPGRLWVEANVDEQDATYVKKGEQVTVRLPSRPADSWTGRVTEVAPSLERSPDGGSSRFLKIRVELQGEKPADLRRGLEADVEGRAVLARDALLVPRAAVRKRDGADVVLAVRGGRVAVLKVEVAAVTPEMASVTSGVDPDTAVILEGGERLEEGDAVRVR